MKQSTYEKISRAAAWTRRIEPTWYVGWAVFCFLLGAIGSNWNAVIIGVMYQCLANVAQQRNEAATIALEWVNRAERWEALAMKWRALYEAEMDEHEH